MCEVVTYPPLPFWHGIPGGLTPGKMVEVRGIVPYGADTFQVNFTEALDSPGNTADRALHLSVRMGQRIVVRNTMANGCWETEERSGGFPFQPGKQFIMLILADSSSYKIAVNGQHQWEFYHRFGLERARMLYIDGSVRIEEVRILSKQPPPVVPTVPQQRPVTVHNPPVPFTHLIAGGLRAGTMIRIHGRPTAYPNRITFNLQAGSAPYPPPDVAFHFDVRFSESAIVRNARVNDSWQHEERAMPHFPFQPGVHFDVLIRVENDGFSVAVNGMPFVHFKHRLFPLERFSTLLIEHDVLLASVAIEQY